MCFLLHDTISVFAKIIFPLSPSQQFGLGQIPFFFFLFFSFKKSIFCVSVVLCWFSCLAFAVVLCCMGLVMSCLSCDCLVLSCDRLALSSFRGLVLWFKIAHIIEGKSHASSRDASYSQFRLVTLMAEFLIITCAVFVPDVRTPLSIVGYVYLYSYLYTHTTFLKMELQMKG